MHTFSGINEGRGVPEAIRESKHHNHAPGGQELRLLASPSGRGIEGRCALQLSLSSGAGVHQRDNTGVFHHETALRGDMSIQISRKEEGRTETYLSIKRQCEGMGKRRDRRSGGGAGSLACEVRLGSGYIVGERVGKIVCRRLEEGGIFRRNHN